LNLPLQAPGKKALNLSPERSTQFDMTRVTKVTQAQILGECSRDGPSNPILPDQADASVTEFIIIRVFPVAFPVYPSETARKR
jgi:hypothetical protein